MGLNFRDVLVAMGLIPPVFEQSLDLGWECAGTVVKRGEGVEHLGLATMSSRWRRRALART